MNKQIKRLMILTLTLVFVFSTLTLGAFATPEDTVSIFSEQPAKIYGDIDLSSQDLITVIVELKEVSKAEAQFKGLSKDVNMLSQVRNSAMNEVLGKTRGSQIKRQYEHVFSGFSIKLPANEVLKMLTVPGVKAVYPNLTYTKTQVGDATILNQEVFTPDMVNSGPFVGANDAWDLGYTGEGVTVAVIDTGVDYTHPDLAHAFGSYKGYDFVDDDFDPQEGTYNGEKQHHGTHVSGTIAANGVIKGIAPDANLLCYRVLGEHGGTTEDIVAAIELAIIDGADVMNLSLGNSLNYPDWPTSIALDWAMYLGVVAVTSNGNAGPANWTVGSPGTSRRAISAGATQLPYDIYSSAIFTTDSVTYDSAKVLGYRLTDEIEALNGNTYEFVDAGLGGVDDFTGIDVTGKVALISRGSYAFVDKAANAKAAGAIATIIYNHSAGEIPYEIPGMAIPSIKLTQEDGQKMLTELENGNNQVTFNINYVETLGEIVADFSSRGPVAGTWMIKPDLSAPGVDIVSTFPDNSYASLQGTSMSSPHIAGASAILLQANPFWTPWDVKAALMNTAADMVDENGNDYPHNTQGAGSMRIVDALETNILISPGSHSFGKFVNTQGIEMKRQRFLIKNLTDSMKKYTFDVSFDGNPSGIDVRIPRHKYVLPGFFNIVSFKVIVDASQLTPGYYEGSINVTDSDSGETVNVPTILFVGEPDYPRITGAYMEKVDDGYEVGAYLPGGAEAISYYLFEYDAANGAIGDYVDMIGSYTNASAPYHEFIWDGTISDGTEVANGDWVLAVYVEQAGVTDLKYYLVTKE